MGQLLTITILGGACFGMPTAMVAERERGVWRRYRLAPTATTAIMISTVVARFVLIVTSCAMQLALARLFYGTTLPAHPAQMFIGLIFASFAFLGMGLIIAMLAESVPAVQALGQAIFLPMIIIGGVGVPLRNLPPWARDVASFLPGRYAVEALQACQNGRGLVDSKFALIALAGIGAAACLAGAKLFRWDVGQETSAREKSWIAVALLAWIGVGLAAEAVERLNHSTETIAFNSASIETPAPPNNLSTQPVAATLAPQSWIDVTIPQINSITFDDLPDDGGTVVPVVGELNTLTDAETKRLTSILNSVDQWPPARSVDFGRRVRAVLNVCSVYDLAADPLEGFVAFEQFQKLQQQIPKERLAQALAWVILNPNDGKVVTSLEGFDIDYQAKEDDVRARSVLYAKKLLLRVLKKRPQP
jgi:ABC-2 type transport system permease protein